MGMNKKILCVLSILFCTTCCFARQISFQIVQHDPVSSELFEQSSEIENTLMNGFFDAGYIVTNSCAELSDSEKQDESLFDKGIGEAFEGYSDYFVQIKIYYNQDSANKGMRQIEQIEWSLVSVGTGIKINENTIASDQIKNVDLYKISSNLVLQIQKAIKA